jgi:anti-sigma B factor antagonist
MSGGRFRRGADRDPPTTARRRIDEGVEADHPRFPRHAPDYEGRRVEAVTESSNFSGTLGDLPDEQCVRSNTRPEYTMQLTTEQINESTLRIALVGRMDVTGTLAIDQSFTVLAAARSAGVIVDLSGVVFLSSIGIRTLISSAKALASRGGRMVLFAPVPLVRKVLETAGIDRIIPIFDDLAAAVAAVDRS